MQGIRPRRAAKSRLAWKPVVQPSSKNPACTWNPPLDTTGHSWGGSKGAWEHATNVSSLLGFLLLEAVYK